MNCNCYVRSPEVKSDRDCPVALKGQSLKK